MPVILARQWLYLQARSAPLELSLCFFPPPARPAVMEYLQKPSLVFCHPQGRDRNFSLAPFVSVTQEVTWLKGTENESGLSGELKTVAYRQIIGSPVFWQADSREGISQQYLKVEFHEVNHTKLFWGLTLSLPPPHCLWLLCHSSHRLLSHGCQYKLFVELIHKRYAFSCSLVFYHLNAYYRWGCASVVRNTDIWLDLPISKNYVNIQAPSQLSASDWQLHLEFPIL